MLDPDDVEALKGQPKGVVMEGLKSCVMDLLVQLTQAQDEDTSKKYFEWLQGSVNRSDSELMIFLRKSKELNELNGKTISAIREDLKSLLPIQNSEDDETIVINQFLYDNVNEGLHAQNLSSLYKCKDCGSTNVVPRSLISHSASVESLIQLFNLQLPDLTNLKLLDIGCGLGSILYGAFYYSNADTICGIELNSKFCEILNTIIKKYNLHDRVNVVNGDVRDFADLMKSFDVVTFNNVLEYFVPVEVQKEIWLFLYQNLKEGILFVTNPDLPTLLKPLNLVEIMDEWVIPCESKINKTLLGGFPETDETFFIYKVIKSNKLR